jgi:hypothetical protein
MEEPIKMVGPGDLGPDALKSAIADDLALTDRLPNLSDRVLHMEDSLEAVDSACARYPENSALTQTRGDVRNQLFDMRNTESQVQAIEERLGQGESDPVDLSLQQTLDVVQQLRRLSETIPNDERLAMIASNVCEGLESFVTAVLSESQPGVEGGGASLGPSPGDLTMALEVIAAIQACPGPDRSSTYKTLRQRFIDAACHSAWGRLDRLFETGLDRADRKEYLHEALTIWTLAPELSENAGSPRLSQLPEDVQRTIEQVLLREVIGSTEGGGPGGLLNASLMARELIEDYVAMVPAIAVAETQTALGATAGESLIRRTRRELSNAGTWQDLESCLSVISVLRTVPGVGEDGRLQKLSWQVRKTSLRLRLRDVSQRARRVLVPAFVTMAGVFGLAAGYVGLAMLIQRLYDYNLPLAP